MFSHVIGQLEVHSEYSELGGQMEGSSGGRTLVILIFWQVNLPPSQTLTMKGKNIGIKSVPVYPTFQLENCIILSNKCTFCIYQ